MTLQAMLSTKGYLDQKLQELGITAKKSLGQNFLINDSVIDKIIKTTLSLNPGSIIEIGPGPGSLTRHLLDFKPLLIELDTQISEHWRSKGQEIIEADALQLNWEDILKRPKPVLVSNLPYQISSSIVVDRTIDMHPLYAMVLMFQKEVAQRIRAQRKDSTYGFLSILAQSFWDIKTIADASPRDFIPAPKVASRVLLFISKKSPVQNKKAFLTFLKSGFKHPRKLLISNLQSYSGLYRQDIEEAFNKLSIPLNTRGDQLLVEQWIELYKILVENR